MQPLLVCMKPLILFCLWCCSALNQIQSRDNVVYMVHSLCVEMCRLEHVIVCVLINSLSFISVTCGPVDEF